MKTFKQLLETLLRPNAYAELLRQAGHTPAQVEAGVKLRKQRIKDLKKAKKGYKKLRKNSDGEVIPAEMRARQILQRFKKPGRTSELAAPPGIHKPGEESRLGQALRLTATAAERKAKEANIAKEDEESLRQIGLSDTQNLSRIYQQRKSRRQRGEQLGRITTW